MKNVHILPTDKPSRFSLNSSGKYHLTNQLYTNSPNFTNQNIYITSNEEIKEGDWIYNEERELSVIQCIGKGSLRGWRKIILTTDTDLIKDNVQAIENDFLEWFVKNPSYEKVQLDSTCKCTECGSSGKSSCDYAYKCNPQIFYKIIIPQEEPKQEITFEDVLDTALDKTKTIFEELKSINPKQKAVEEMELRIKGINVDTGFRLGTSKQETLEEVCNRINFITPRERMAYYNGLKNGAKWQQERMYSEAIEFAEWIRIKDFQTTSKDNWIGLDMKYYTTEELFEQFKKK